MKANLKCTNKECGKFLYQVEILDDVYRCDVCGRFMVEDEPFLKDIEQEDFNDSSFVDTFMRGKNR